MFPGWFLLCLLARDDPLDASNAPSPDQQFRALADAHEVAYRDFVKSSLEAKTEADYEAVNDQWCETLGQTRESVVGASATISLGDAVDAPQFNWATGGDAPWFGQTNTTWDLEDAAQSGPVNSFGESWIETTIDGPGQLEFRWKLAAEPGEVSVGRQPEQQFIPEREQFIAGWGAGRARV